MFTPHVENYGYGWFVREELGHRLVEHRGGLNGFLSMIQRFPDDDVVVITLFNYVSTFAREVNRGLAALALGLPYEPALIPEGIDVGDRVLRGLVGEYDLMGSVLQVAFEDGRLWIDHPDMQRSEAIPQTETTYFVRKANALLHFRLSDRGSVEQLILRQGERWIPCSPLAGRGKPADEPGVSG
jgi:hypothetical protein